MLKLIELLLPHSFFSWWIHVSYAVSGYRFLDVLYVCVSVLSSSWVPAAESGSSFLCSPLLPMFTAEDALGYKVFFLDAIEDSPT